MSIRSFYFVNSFPSCYDNADSQADDSTDDSSSDDQSNDSSSDPATFTQEDVNRLLAEDRRKNTKQLEEIKSQYEDILTNKHVPAEKAEELKGTLAALKQQLASKENQLKSELQRKEEEFQAELASKESEAKQWEQRYTEVTINHALQAAAVEHEAFNPNQLIGLLKPNTRMVDDSPVVEIDDLTPDGKPTKSTLGPMDAVKRMSELNDLYGNLFRSNIAAGLGGNSSAGTPGRGKLTAKQLADMSQDEYEKLRRENPQLLKEIS